jgi:hypothetical protein
VDDVSWRLIIQNGGGEELQVRDMAFSGMSYMLDCVDEDYKCLSFGLNWAKKQRICHYQKV